MFRAKYNREKSILGGNIPNDYTNGKSYLAFDRGIKTIIEDEDSAPTIVINLPEENLQDTAQLIIKWLKDYDFLRKGPNLEYFLNVEED